ncbi:hypothetical protein B0G76_7205 [Paraburkholderia sp. BL23I1N1]|nr:hypothetical protein B0G76_7205 [Paraburkholderia sp. BL23I1N1]
MLTWRPVFCHLTVSNLIALEEIYLYRQVNANRWLPDLHRQIASLAFAKTIVLEIWLRSRKIADFWPVIQQNIHGRACPRTTVVLSGMSDMYRHVVMLCSASGCCSTSARAQIERELRLIASARSRPSAGSTSWTARRADQFSTAVAMDKRNHYSVELGTSTVGNLILTSIAAVCRSATLDPPGSLAISDLMSVALSVCDFRAGTVYDRSWPLSASCNVNAQRERRIATIVGTRPRAGFRRARYRTTEVRPSSPFAKAPARRVRCRPPILEVDPVGRTDLQLSLMCC